MFEVIASMSIGLSLGKMLNLDEDVILGPIYVLPENTKYTKYRNRAILDSFYLETF